MSNDQMSLDFSKKPDFDGDDYNAERDKQRLSGQLLDIFNIVKDGNWYSVTDIEELTGYKGTSISAQLRNLRKTRFGGYDIERRHISDGFYQYRLKT